MVHDLKDSIMDCPPHIAMFNHPAAVQIRGRLKSGTGVVFGLLGVLNLAHGELVMIGAYCAYVAQTHGWPFIAALPMAIVVCGALGFVVERWLVSPLYHRPFDTLVLTWGLSLLIRKCAEAMFMIM